MTTIPRRHALKALGLGAAAVALEPRAAAAEEPKKKTNFQGAGFYRFRVGTMELALVSDGGFTVQPYPTFATNAAKEDAEKELRRRFVSPDAATMHVNMLVIRSGDRVALVDTGAGSFFGPTGGRLAAHLANLGVRPNDVDVVVLTHLHLDHVGGLLDAKGAPVFGNAEVVVADAERAFWGGSPDLSGMKVPVDMRNNIAAIAKGALKGAADRIRVVKPGQPLMDGVETVDAAGHTPGHLALNIHSGDDHLLYITDAIHFAPMQLAHPDWQVAFDTDPVRAAKTRRTLLDRAAADRSLVCGAHLPFPALGHLRARGTGFEWEPAIWQW